MSKRKLLVVPLPLFCYGVFVCVNVSSSPVSASCRRCFPTGTEAHLTKLAHMLFSPNGATQETLLTCVCHPDKHACSNAQAA